MKSLKIINQSYLKMVKSYKLDQKYQEHHAKIFDTYVV